MMVYCRTLPKCIGISRKKMMSKMGSNIFLRNYCEASSDLSESKCVSHPIYKQMKYNDSSSDYSKFDQTSKMSPYSLSNICSPLVSKSPCSRVLPSHYEMSHNYSSTRSVHTSPPLSDIYIIHNEEEFEDKVMRSALPVVINFHADWCEPCHALKPLLENLAKKFNGKMHLAEVRIDDHVALLQTFEVTAVPAVVAIVKGQVAEKFVGLISEPEVRAFITSMIKE